MTKYELIGFIVTMIGVLVASVMLYSNCFAEKKNANRNMVIATLLTISAALLIAMYIDCIYYKDFVLWRFAVNTFSVYSITIGISAILTMFKEHNEYRGGCYYRKLVKITEDVIEKKANMKMDDCMPYKMPAVNNTSCIKSDCCEMVSGKVISLEEARMKRK